MDTPHRRFPLETLSSTAPPPRASGSNSEAPAPSPNSVPTDPLTAEQLEAIRQQIIVALCTCFDPEIPVNIYELGLIYGIDVQPSGDVHIRMTLTSPGCPVAGSLPLEVRAKIQAIPGVRTAQVDVVWDPPWDKDRMSEAAKLQLGIEDW
jgi:FeS assembly SUF system protein